MNEDRISKLEREINNIKITITNIETSLEYVKEQLAEMRTTVNEVLQNVLGWNGKMAKQYVSKERGEEISRAVEKHDQMLVEVRNSVNMIKWAIGIWMGIITTIMASILYYLFGR